MTQEYKGRDFNLIIIQAMRDRDYLVSACQYLEPSFFREIGTVAQFLAFDVIKSYYQKYTRAPDWGVINDEVGKKIDRYFQDKTNPAITEIYSGLIDIVQSSNLYGDSSLPLAQDLLTFMVKKCHFEPQAQQAIQSAISSKQLAGLGNVLAEYEAKFNALTGTGLISGDELDISPDEKSIRIPLGIPWFDKLFGNGQGLQAGSGIGLCVPTGNGKSTFGYQATGSVVLTGRHAYFAIFEEGPSIQVRRALRSAVTGLSVENLEKCGDDWRKAAEMEGLPVEIVASKVALQKQYLHIRDFTTPELLEAGFDRINSDIQILARQGKAPVVAFVDYAQRVSDRLIAAAAKEHRRLEVEAAMKQVGFLANDVANRHNMLVFIATQMSPSAIERGPTAKLDMMSSSGARLFAEALKVMINITARHKDHAFQTLHVAKARNDPPDQTVIIKGDLAHTRFDEVAGWTVKGKRFVQVGSKTPVIPQETVKRNNSQVE